MRIFKILLISTSLFLFACEDEALGKNDGKNDGNNSNVTNPSNQSGNNHGGIDHGGNNHGGNDHGGIDQGGNDHGGNNHGGNDHGGNDQGGNNQGGNNPNLGGGSDNQAGLNRQLLLQLVNQARARGVNCGGQSMPPVARLVWNNKLEQASINHSEDMRRSGNFSHTGSNGSSMTNRAAAVNYMYRALGENIANGHRNERHVMQGWLTSPGHCKNIMNGSFKEMGAAKRGRYWTQVFGARR